MYKMDHMSDVEMLNAGNNSKKRENENFDDSDIIPTTPINETKKKRIHKKKAKIDEIIIVNRDLNVEIQSTKTGKYVINKPFVYHNIEEVLKYTVNCLPKNNNIHIIGVLRFSGDKGYHLDEPIFDNYCRKKLSILLDFTVATEIPDENEIISAFGSIEFINFNSVFVVRFFRKELRIVANKYIENLQKMRKYVPRDYLRTISNNTHDY